MATIAPTTTTHFQINPTQVVTICFKVTLMDIPTLLLILATHSATIEEALAIPSATLPLLSTTVEVETISSMVVEAITYSVVPMAEVIIYLIDKEITILLDPLYLHNT